MIKTTEQKHWVNGYQLRGGYFRTLNISLLGYGIMFSYPIANSINVTLFKLV